MTIREQAEQAAAAARKLAVISPEVKNKALNAMADALLAEKEAILAANALDIEAGKAKNMKASL
ncbi:MAG: gamma-glutamyl-phosphate reductase, partial [Acidaminococcaceae bacterium]|nr:gamma-glutamyl-phosphate reductase [Acidaminococcaceae bacterium]